MQYPSDRNSNSYPFQNPLLEDLFADTALKALLTGFNGSQPWRGDCFHPNETDAQAYADAVIEELRRMGR